MTNTNPETGVRFGVIAMNSLDGDLANELFHGPDAVDLSYQDAYQGAKTEANDRFNRELEDAEIDAAESGGLTDDEREDFITRHLESTLGTSDCEEYVDNCLEEFSDCCQIDEPVIEGEAEGVKYRISWLGGAPILSVLEGPIGYANELCSPCVPNAADLDSGFDTGEVADGCTAYVCYVVPRDWLAREVA